MNLISQVQPAPGQPPDQRVWPPATVMATSIFATTFVQLQGLGYLPFNHLWITTMGLDSNQAATYMTLSLMPWSFKAFAGLIVDGVPLFGSRRRNYLLLSSVAAILFWVAMGCVPEDVSHRNILFGLVFAMNVAIVLGSATAAGLLVEAGQRFGATGRLSSLRVFAQTSGNGLGVWLGGLLATYALMYTSLVAILPLIAMFLVVWLLQRETPVVLPAGYSFWGQLGATFSSLWQQIKNVIRWEMLLPALLIFFIQAVPTFRSTAFYEYQTKTLHYTDAALGTLQLVGCGVSLLSTGIYAFWCRKVSLRVSLYGAVLITALSAIPYLYYAPYTPYMARALVIESVGTFLVYGAYLPLMDMAVRSTPKGSEALGYSLLISVWSIGLMVGTKTGPMLYEGVFNQDMNKLIWLNAAVTLAALLLVFLLPGKLVARREGG